MRVKCGRMPESGSPRLKLGGETWELIGGSLGGGQMPETWDA